MQVTHVEDSITHAVFGQKSSIGFTMAETPEFFQVLSKSLYTNPKLAMCRETVCNAWDAHIAAGITDTPIEITLTDEKLIITDFGSGIPKRLIGEIYTVYGRSTKLNDGKQTGGFGLGCKSPFAYAEHFTVESSCEGIATTYALSCSSGESYGIPTLKEIVSLPAEVTGLSVTIPLHTSVREIREILEKVITDGNIFATINGKIISRLEMPEGWAWTNTLSTSGNLYIRYGNVIYPIPDHAELAGAKKTITSIAAELHIHMGLLLQAPPDSISVAPSREALTLSDTTIATINALVSDYQSFYAKCQRKVLATHTQNIDQCASVEDVITYSMQGVGYIPTALQQCTTATELVEYMVARLLYMGSKSVYKHVYLAAIDKLNAMGHLDKHQTHALKAIKYPNDNYAMHHGCRRGYITRGEGFAAPLQVFHKKLFCNIAKAEEVDIEKLFRSGTLRDGNIYAVTGKSAEALPHEVLLLSRKVIVITRARSRVHKQLGNYNKEASQLKEAHLVYAIGTSKNEYLKAIEFFTKQGYEIIDLVPVAETSVKKDTAFPAKTKRTGFINAAPYVDFSSTYYKRAACRQDNNEGRTTYVKTPDWYIYTANDSNTGICTFAQYVKGYQSLFANTVGAIALTSQKRDSAIKMGIPKIEEYLLAKCLQIVKANIAEAAIIMQQSKINSNLRMAFKELILRMPALAKHYDLVAITSSEVAIAANVLLAFIERYRYYPSTSQYTKEIETLVESVTLTSQQKKLIKLLNTDFVGSINWSTLNRLCPKNAELPKHVRVLIGSVLTHQEI